MSFLEEDKSNSVSWTLIIAISILLIIIGVVFWIITTTKSYDDSTLCELNTETLLTVVLFDKTGGFSENQKRLVTKAINKEKNALTTGERLAVYEIDSDTMKGLSTPIFDKCKPRDGSKINIIYENDKLIKAVFNKQYSSVLTKVTNKLITAENALSSPLIESLQDLVAISSLNDKVKLKRIVFISDLLQHSDNISFYSSRPESFNFEAVLPLVPDLFEVDIQLYWLLREGKERGIQNANLIPWWERFFENAGITDLKIMKVR